MLTESKNHLQATAMTHCAAGHANRHVSDWAKHLQGNKRPKWGSAPRSAMKSVLLNFEKMDGL
ncbi:MAG TPA: hypothetical protein DDW52_03160 [Planctomycetaceae bacterium]|nr:hypothetical protein [Planctomycetaceae bacterium]